MITHPKSCVDTNGASPAVACRLFGVSFRAESALHRGEPGGGGDAFKGKSLDQETPPVIVRRSEKNVPARINGELLRDSLQGGTQPTGRDFEGFSIFLSQQC